MLHTPAVQLAVPLAELQASLQAEQCARLLPRLASHPSAALPLQSP